MEQHPVADGMDTCFRRLKQELLPVREAGHGPHIQRNSMMGALQELKILQLQTVLEQLEISGQPRRSALPSHQVYCSPPVSHPVSPVCSSGGGDQHLHRSSLMSPTSSHHPLPGRSLGESRCSQENGHGSVPVPRGPVPYHTLPPAQTVDFPKTPQNLHQIRHSLDSDFHAGATDESSDWTSTLMSCGRNRQPLVLGNNVFADLVGNWLDLPDLEKQTLAKKEEEEKESAQHLQLGCSQEICTRFSLTTNIFKKLLRSVRPDKDKFSKDKPGWMSLDSPNAEPFKRPKKVNKGTFYHPVHSGSAGQ